MVKKWSWQSKRIHDLDKWMTVKERVMYGNTDMTEHQNWEPVMKRA